MARRTGAQRLSRLYAGEVVVEHYEGGRTAYRHTGKRKFLISEQVFEKSPGTGIYITSKAAERLSGSADELRELGVYAPYAEPLAAVCRSVWARHEKQISLGNVNSNTGNVQVTVTGLEPAMLAFVRGEAMRSGAYELSVKAQDYLQRMLDAFVEMIRGIAEEVLNELVYTPNKGQAYLAASAMAAKARFKNITPADIGMSETFPRDTRYLREGVRQNELLRDFKAGDVWFGATSPRYTLHGDTGGLLKRYQYGQSNVLRRRYGHYGTSFPRVLNEMEYELGRRQYTGSPFTYEKLTPLGQLSIHKRLYEGRYVPDETSFRRLHRPIAGDVDVFGTYEVAEVEHRKRGGIERAWLEAGESYQARLQRAITRPGLVGLSYLFQQAVGQLHQAVGTGQALEQARTMLRAPYYMRTERLKMSVLRGINRYGNNIVLGVDESVYSSSDVNPYWQFVEKGHEVVIPRPLGRGQPNQYEMFKTGNVVPGRPFMETLFTRVRAEVLPLLENACRKAGLTIEKASYAYIQDASLQKVANVRGMLRVSTRVD